MRKEMRKLVLGLLLPLAGCLPAPHRVELTPPVSGTVSRAGWPVAGARVRITAQGAERSAEAVSDGDGHFQLPPLTELAMTTSLLSDSSYGFVLEITDGDSGYPGLTLTEQGFPPRNLPLDCDLAHPQGLGGDMHFCRKR
jgi:hypothetical protein